MASSGISRQSIAQASRLVARTARGSNACRASAHFPPQAHRAALIPAAAVVDTVVSSSRRAFSTCPRLRVPDGGHPATHQQTARAAGAKLVVVELSDSEYHDIADEHMDKILAKLEELQEIDENADVEFSAGVMTVAIPNKGTYVLNKQPPNKQIWLSSPISGPKRYDWCVSSGTEQGDKQGTKGYWIYSRDGTSLDELLHQELGVDIEGSEES